MKFQKNDPLKISIWLNFELKFEKLDEITISIKWPNSAKSIQFGEIAYSAEI